PDPWPKARHHKRRFLQMAMLDELARVLKPGAELRFATDDKSYLPYALERLLAHPQFEWLARGMNDWTTRPGDWGGIVIALIFLAGFLALLFGPNTLEGLEKTDQVLNRIEKENIAKAEK